MKLTIPSWATDIQHEGDKLFIAWMYHISEKHGFNIQYRLYPHDVRMICQRFYIDPGATWGEWSRWVYFGGIDNHNWFFQWAKIPRFTVEHEFVEESSHLVWGYLMGREAEEELVTPFNGWQRRTPDSLLGHRKLKKFKYYKHRGQKDGL